MRLTEKRLQNGIAYCWGVDSMESQRKYWMWLHFGSLICMSKKERKDYKNV